MILSYSLDRFVDQIKDGRKKHTIRADPKRRWKAGMKIQHWRGNPRNVKQNPYQFAEGECKGVQDVLIKRSDVCEIGMEVYIMSSRPRNRLKTLEVFDLADNDGLDIREFRDWFLPSGTNEFRGRIIHFTDLIY